MKRNESDELAVKRLSRCLDVLINMDEQDIYKLADENCNLIILAKRLMEMDFGSDREVRIELKNRLLNTLLDRDMNKALSLQELDQIAAGIEIREDFKFWNN